MQLAVPERVSPTSYSISPALFLFCVHLPERGRERFFIPAERASTLAELSRLPSPLSSS